jgi:very-short-patch-repair endonuclease/predicted transcriptional regulator of viral defense system
MRRIRNSGSEATWQAVGAFASRQQGLVTRGQLRDLGFSDNAISKATERGWLHPVFHGVYCVGHRYLTPHGRLLAATLACGEGSVVSHGTAAWLYGLSSSKPKEVDVIAPVEAGRKIAGVRRRFVPLPEGREVWRRSGVPVTSPARTIVDCAGSDPEGVAGMIEQAAVLSLLDVVAIDRVLDGPRRRGTKRLRRVLEPWRRYRPGIKIRSRMEAKLLPLLTEAALPIPQTNVRLRAGRRTYEVDFLWRAEKVVVETDGGRFHNNPAAGSRDSDRNHALTAAGYLIPRLGWEDLRDRPDQTMAEIRRLLYQRGPR